MADKKRTKISPSKNPTNKSITDDLTLEDVLELGGSKEDYELVKDLNDDGEEIDGLKHDYDADPISKDTIKELINELGFENIWKDNESETSGKDVAKKKKVKLAVMEGYDEDNVQTINLVKEKKKSKNKYKVQDNEVSSTTVPEDESTETADLTRLVYQPRKNLLIKLSDKWYNKQFQGDPTSFEEADKSLVLNLTEYASNALTNEASIYKAERDKKSNAAWMRTVMTSGTLSDKMAALTLQIQDGPVHNLFNLDRLLEMVNKKGKRECLQALETLRDLFISDLLPDDRKLKEFEQHPLRELQSIASGNKDTRDRRLIMWYFEGQLKQRYSQFVESLEKISHDTVAISKKKAINAMFELLVQKPEQEKILLANVINKLGDPDFKVASNAAHLLTRLVDHHPNMKAVVVLEVERLLYRPNISTKAQYYGICFLNQLVLSSAEKDLAARLIGIYFSFFKVFVKRGDVDSKMLSALLSGVNRAYPYAKVDKAKILEHTDTLYKVVHIVNFNTSVQALMLLYQVTSSDDSMTDRYYMALYRKLLDPGLKKSNKHTMFLNLLFKSLKKDVSEKRNKAFIKRLLQICPCQGPSFICASLVLLSEVIRVKPGLLSFKHTSEDLDDEEHFVDIHDSDSDSDSDSDNKDVHKATNVRPVTQSWVHRKQTGNKLADMSYDPLHRNPLYSQADMEVVLELSNLSQHYHPSVALFAHTILKNEVINYGGDPLLDFTLIRFLDRFVYRNPKKKSYAEAKGTGVLHLEKKTYCPKGIKRLPVNSEEYIAKGEENIPVDEKFFYRYFSKKAEKGEKRKIVDDESDGSVSDTDFDDYLNTVEPQMVGDQDMKFDFAGEFSKKTTKTKKKRGPSDNNDLDLSDEEIDFGDDFADAFNENDDEEATEDTQATNDVEFEGDFLESDNGEFDEETASFNDEDDFDSQPSNKRTTKKRSLNEIGSGSLFVAADEFADMIDENMGSKLDSTTSNAVSNRDNSDAKQLKWEMKQASSSSWRGKKARKNTHRQPTGKKFKQKGRKLK